MPEIRSSYSLLGEMGAQRVVRRQLTKALRNVLSTVSPTSKELLCEQLESKLREQQGELMYAATPEFAPEAQAEMNVAFQESFRELIAETMEILRTEPPGAQS